MGASRFSDFSQTGAEGQTVRTSSHRNRKNFSVAHAVVERLESRQLLTATTQIDSGLGPSSSIDSAPIVSIIGTISPSTADHGVHTTVSVPAGGAVSFEFTLEPGDDYRLFFHHSGEDLTVIADTPSGTADIYPGAPGRFEQVAIPLEAGKYSITVTDNGSQPITVWELLTYNGIGQSHSLNLELAATAEGTPGMGVIPLTINSSTSSIAAILNESQPAATAAVGLAVTLETMPIGNPTIGTPFALTLAANAGLPDQPVTGTDATFALADVTGPFIRPKAPRPPPNQILAGLESPLRSAITPDLDEQALESVALIDRLVQTLNLSRPLEPSANRTRADAPDADQTANSDTTRLAHQNARHPGIDLTNFGFAVTIGMAAAAVNYRRKIPKGRQIPATSLKFAIPNGI
jgi:hypothetical protein